MAKQTVVDSVRAVLESIPGAQFLYVSGRKHAKIWWTYKGYKRVTVTPKTESDKRAHDNARAFVRRQVREIDSA